MVDLSAANLRESAEILLPVRNFVVDSLPEQSVTGLKPSSGRLIEPNVGIT